MSNFISSYISVGEALGIVLFLLLFVIVLLILVVFNNRKMHDITYPVYDYILKGAQDKAQKITYDARKDAREMLVDAELEGVKIVAKDKLESRKIEADYEEKLAQLTDQTQELLKKYGEETHKRLAEVTGSLEKSIADGISRNESFLQNETNKLSKQLLTTFTTLEANAKEQIRSNVEKEFISVKKVIETYRQERFALIDNQIVSLIENATGIALNKKLNLTEHTDLIYRALEEAKSKDTFS